MIFEIVWESCKRPIAEEVLSINRPGLHYRKLLEESLQPLQTKIGIFFKLGRCDDVSLYVLWLATRVCLGSRSALIGGCKEIVHARCSHQCSTHCESCVARDSSKRRWAP